MLGDTPLLEAPQPFEPYDADADAAALDSQPLQDYSSAWEQPEPEPAPAPEPEPEPEQAGAEAKTDNEASAREFVELYDLAQSFGFHFWSGRAAETFQLPKYAKDRAAHHLAKGLEKMGGMEPPWWLGLLLALGPVTFVNWASAKEYKAQQAEAERQQREAKARANWQQASGGAAIEPDAITLAGKEVAFTRTAPPKPGKTYGTCQHCGGPVQKKGRKYCGQSCAAKAINERKRSEKEQAQ